MSGTCRASRATATAISACAPLLTLSPHAPRLCGGPPRRGGPSNSVFAWRCLPVLRGRCAVAVGVQVRMRPTLEEVDRHSEDGTALVAAAAGQASAAAPAPGLRQLSLHSSVQVRLEFDTEDFEDLFAQATQQQAPPGDTQAPPATGGMAKEGRVRLPAADAALAPRGCRARFTGVPSAAADADDSHLPSLRKRSASFSGAKAASSSGEVPRGISRARSAAGSTRRRSSLLGASFPAIGAQR